MVPWAQPGPAPPQRFSPRGSVSRFFGFPSFCVVRYAPCRIHSTPGFVFEHFTTATGYFDWNCIKTTWSVFDVAFAQSLLVWHGVLPCFLLFGKPVPLFHSAQGQSAGSRISHQPSQATLCETLLSQMFCYLLIPISFSQSSELGLIAITKTRPSAGACTGREFIWCFAYLQNFTFSPCFSCSILSPRCSYSSVGPAQVLVAPTSPPHVLVDQCLHLHGYMLSQTRQSGVAEDESLKPF